MTATLTLENFRRVVRGHSTYGNSSLFTLTPSLCYAPFIISLFFFVFVFVRFLEFPDCYSCRYITSDTIRIDRLGPHFPIIGRLSFYSRYGVTFGTSLTLW